MWLFKGGCLYIFSLNTILNASFSPTLSKLDLSNFVGVSVLLCLCIPDFKTLTLFQGNRSQKGRTAFVLISRSFCLINFKLCSFCKWLRSHTECIPPPPSNFVCISGRQLQHFLTSKTWLTLYWIEFKWRLSKCLVITSIELYTFMLVSIIFIKFQSQRGSRRTFKKLSFIHLLLIQT